MNDYLDTSIIVKWFKKGECGSEKALLILDSMAKEKRPFFLHRYGLLELVRTLKRSKFPDSKTRSAAFDISHFYRTGLLISCDDETVYRTATKIQIDLGLHAPDALHISSAINWKCNRILSDDKHFFNDTTKQYLHPLSIEVLTLDDIDLTFGNADR